MRDIDVEFQMSEDLQRVTMKFTHRSGWGSARKWQTTISRRRLERALQSAKITVPWDRL